MNKYVKEFLKRGFMFAGLGPLVLAIVYLFLGRFINDFSLSGSQAFLSIVSVYILAFVHAGVSVFNQIEYWSIAKSLLCHFASLYAAYSLCYVANSWIPFEPKVLLIFTGIFVAGYFIVWTIVYFSVKASSKRFNQKLR